MTKHCVACWVTLKPIFHEKLGSHWLPNANEIDTKKYEMYMANTRNLHLGPIANLYSTDLRLGFTLGILAILDTNMLVQPTQNFAFRV